jgi:hypothetical protein
VIEDYQCIRVNGNEWKTGSSFGGVARKMRGIEMKYIRRVNNF